MSTSTTASRFDLLTKRPPTPPRDLSNAVDEAITFLASSNEVDQLTAKTTAHPVPEDVESCAPSSQEHPTIHTCPRRVDFSPHPRYHKIAAVGQPSSPSAQLEKCLPSNREAKPLRSILKNSHALPPTPDDLDTKLEYFSPGTPGSFKKMLQSVIQQLAGLSRSAKLDAYIALNGALRVYEDPPDVTPMTERMDVLIQFMTRDMAWKGTDGKLDAQIASQALNLAFSLLLHRKLCEHLDTDFRTFLVDRSITVLESPNMPKPIMKQHMALMGLPKFRSALSNSARADKLITALQSIEERCSGNGIVGSRLLVYFRLIDQAPNAMLNRMADWLPHIFHAMSSSIQDLRQQAIATCTQGGLHLGSQPNAAKVMEQLFEDEDEDGQSYWTFLTLRLVEMLGDKETGLYVPQILAAIGLYFRSKRRPLAKWSKLKKWLSLMQKCLNSSDIFVRHQAIVAWNRVVFTVMPDTGTGDQMLTVLQAPIATALAMSRNDNFAKRVRHYMLGCFYTMLHYVLRPGLPLEQYDRAWQLIVLPIMSQMVKGSKGRGDACRVLQGLFKPSQSVWNVNAALESNPIKPEDLPRLDPKWVRSRIAKVLAIVEPIVDVELQASGDDLELHATWRALMECISDAGAQEVRTSHDLKEAIAALINFSRNMRTRLPIAQGTASPFLFDRWTSFVCTAVECLGANPFVEETLARTDSDAVEVVPTPSHRISKQQRTPVSPMVVLFGQFYPPPSSEYAGEAYTDCAREVLGCFITAKSTKAGKLEMMNRLLHIVHGQHFPTSIDEPAASLWLAFAQTAQEVLDSRTPSGSEQESQSPGYGLHHSLSIFVRGLGLPLNAWTQKNLTTLYSALCGAASTNAGEGGVVLAVIEPLASAILEHSEITEVDVFLTHMMLGQAPWPKSKLIMEHARESLWGVSLQPQKVSVFDPYDRFYGLISAVLRHMYDVSATDIESHASASDLLQRIVGFLGRAPISLLAPALRKTQEGFCIWLGDGERKLAGQLQSHQMVCTAWTAIFDLIQRLPSVDSNVLKALQPLLVAAFASPCRKIVNDTIIFWNQTFGQQTSLEYPAKLEAVLRTRSADANLDLPSFPENNEDTSSISLPEFYDTESQGEDQPQLNKPASSLRVLQTVLPRPSTAHVSPLRRPTSSASSTARAAQQPGSTTPKARLRHDDSQIDFAPIESSPLPSNDESQLLTEHQREVKGRQQKDASLFPELSSSPFPQPKPLSKVAQKRLDFHTAVEAPSDQDTPKATRNADVLPSDDLPSSPTPSSASRGRKAQLDALNEDDDAPIEDPPSSPPQAPEHSVLLMDMQTRAEHQGAEDEANMDIDDDAELPISLPPRTDEHGRVEADTNLQSDITTDDDVPGDGFPSDSQLPTAQLLMEAEEAEQRSATKASTPRVAITEKTPIKTSGHNAVEPVADKEGPSSTSQSIAAADILRVEDSFVEQAEGDSQSITASPSEGSQKSSRKRRRTHETVFTARKRTKQSPLQRLWSSFTGRSQDNDEEEDIGENIVVASSQLKPPTPSTKVEQNPTSKDAKPMRPPPKRKPGRPRKSATPTPSLETAASTQSSKRHVRSRRTSETPTPAAGHEGPAKSLKRRASALSVASVDSMADSTGIVMDTPAPVKAAKYARVRSRAFQDVEEDQNSAGSQAREAVAVVIDNARPSPHATAPSGRRSPIIEGDQHATPKKQSTDPPTAAGTPGRAILTPRSIIGRLRNVLSDLKGMVLGSQEERELDDVLFEMRREVHEAGRRGRET